MNYSKAAKKSMKKHRGLNTKFTAVLLSCLFACTVTGCGADDDGAGASYQEMTTEAVTEIATEASTEIATEAVTEAATEATEAVTEAATEATEASTEATEASTEATEASTEATEASTEATDAASEDSSTEDSSTEDSSTEAAAEKCGGDFLAALPFESAQNLVFTSGAGGWSTTLTLNPDGSFTGSYSDSEMGETGDGYDATVYVCDFQGSFSQITKVDDNTYSMKLDSLTTDAYSSAEWIEETDGANVRYVVSTAYGIDGGTTFYLYLPGTPVSSLPQAFIDWYTPLGLTDSETLSGYALYNESEEVGFY